MRTRVIRLAAALGLLAVSLVPVSAASASACYDDFYQVNARDLGLRPWPGAAPYAYMYSGDLVFKDRSSPSGSWMRVFSYRNQQWGWALSEYMRFHHQVYNNNCGTPV
jgi:hypothetical protein